MSFLSLLTGSFSTPAAENPTVAMVEAAYRDLGLDARYINCEVAPGGAGRRRARRAGDGLEGLQLLAPAQGGGDRAPRRARRVGGADRGGQLRRRPRRPLDRREHRRQGFRRLAADRRRPGGQVAGPARRGRGGAGHRGRVGPGRRDVDHGRQPRPRARRGARASLVGGLHRAAARGRGRASRAGGTDILVNATSIGFCPTGGRWPSCRDSGPGWWWPTSSRTRRGRA